VCLPYLLRRRASIALQNSSGTTLQPHFGLEYTLIFNISNDFQINGGVQALITTSSGKLLTDETEHASCSYTRLSCVSPYTSREITEDKRCDGVHCNKRIWIAN